MITRDSNGTQIRTSFIDIKLAIGELVMNGFSPAVEITSSNAGKTMACRLYDRATGETICPTYRDGTTWKVKSLAIVDWIDDYSVDHQLTEVCPECGYCELSDGFGNNDCPECYCQDDKTVRMVVIKA